MKYTKEYLTELVNESKCMWDVVMNAGMGRNEGNYNYLHRLINRYNISTLHFEDQRKGIRRSKLTLDDFLVKDRHISINGNKMKAKLYKAGLKQPICEKCGQNEWWNGEKISLILDHINGDRDNNLLENLRIVCPNCNATLPTHGGKNRSTKSNTINKEKVKKRFADEFINKVKESEIDITIRGWQQKLGKFLNTTATSAVRNLKKHMPELHKICWKQETYWKNKGLKHREID